MREYNVKITFNDGGTATPGSPILAESEEQACNEFIDQVNSLKDEDRYIKEVHVERVKSREEIILMDRLNFVEEVAAQASDDATKAKVYVFMLYIALVITIILGII